MAVDAHDDLTRGRGDRGIEPIGGATSRVGHQANSGISRGDLGGHLISAVARGAEGEHDLERARIVLGEDHRHGVAQVPLLVEQRHDDADRGVAPRLAVTLSSFVVAGVGRVERGPAYLSARPVL